MGERRVFVPCGQYFGNEVSCHEGFRVDDDVWAENLQPDVMYQPCPCHPGCCAACGGNGVLQRMDIDSDECEACSGTGWTNGECDHPLNYIEGASNG